MTDKIEWNEELLKLPVLSIRPPWASLIVCGFKDIENRNWYTNFRGKFLIHQSKTFDYEGYDWIKRNFDISTFGWVKYETRQQPEKCYDMGGIIGVSEIVDCVSHSDSKWFFGKFGFVLKNSQQLPFYPCKGQLSFFHLNVQYKDIENVLHGKDF